MAGGAIVGGRVMALWALAWGGSTVIGGPLVGFTAQELGSRWGLIAGGAPTILLGLIIYPLLRRRDARLQAEHPPGAQV